MTRRLNDGAPVMERTRSMVGRERCRVVEMFLARCSRVSKGVSKHRSVQERLRALEGISGTRLREPGNYLFFFRVRYPVGWLKNNPIPSVAGFARRCFGSCFAFLLTASKVERQNEDGASMPGEKGIRGQHSQPGTTEPRQVRLEPQAPTPLVFWCRTCRISTANVG